MEQIQTQDAQITVLLKGHAHDQLFEAVYDQLRWMARRAMAGERNEHTLQATALVNEAFVALFKKENIDWQNRQHFFAQMATTMRHKLSDHARKIGNRDGRLKVPLDEARIGSVENRDELLALDEALTSLRAFDPELERIVELRFYGGLTEEEIADELNMSARSVRRKWAAARGLMFDLLNKSARPVT